MVVLVLVFPWQARRACQRQRSILLEFDTRGEVEDFQRLVGKLALFETYEVIAQVRDEHLLLKPNQLVWLGATYQQVHQVLLNMFNINRAININSAININTAININIKSIVGLAKYHTQVLQSDSLSQHSPFLGDRIPLPIQPDGRRLDVEPRSECAAPRRRRLCQS